MERARFPFLFDVHPDPCADGATIRTRTLEFELEPVIREAGVLEQDVGIHVAGHRTTHVFVHILIPVIVDVSKGNAMAFLQVSKAAGCGDVLEEASLRVSIHPVRNHREQVRVAGAEVEVEPAVVVEVSEVATHGVEQPIQLHRSRDVLERAVAAIAIEARVGALVGQAEVIRRHIADIGDLVAGHEDVLPAIVIVIEKPAGKTVERLGDTRDSGNIGEEPAVRGPQFRIAGAVIAEQPVRATQHRDVEIGTAIIIEVSGHHSLHVVAHRHAAQARDLLEGPVALVVKQFAEMPRLGGAGKRLIAHEQIQPAVSIEVEPGGCLRRMKQKEPGCFGHIFERAVSPVSQQRVRVPSLFAHPGAAQHEHVEVPIIVEVRLHKVQSAGQSREARFPRPVGECSVAVVPIEVHLIAQADGRHHHVQQVVAIEVVHDAATGQFVRRQAGKRCDFAEAWKLDVGGEHLRRNEPARRDFVGIIAHRHAGHVQEPACRHAVGKFDQKIG